MLELDLIEQGGNLDGILICQMSLMLWKVTNADGVSTPDELMPIGSSWIVSIELDYGVNETFDSSANYLPYWSRAKTASTKGPGMTKVIDLFFRNYRRMITTL